MRYLLAVMAGAAIVSGCSPSEPVYLVHKTGSNYAQRMADLDRCEFAAIQAVPRALATEVSGGFSSPGTLQCSSAGGLTTCNRIGAIDIPATATTYDANADLRKRYTDRCLTSAGYSVYPKPPCRTDSERAAYRATLDNQPPASQIACVTPRV